MNGFVLGVLRKVKYEMKFSKKQWIHKAKIKSVGGTDLVRKNIAQVELSKLGYKALQNETLTNPNFIARSRHPDLIVKIYGEKVPIELDGAVHGSGDEVSESKQTKYRNDDYVRAGFLPVIANEEWLKVNNIDQQTYMKCILFNFEQQLRALKRLKQ